MDIPIGTIILMLASSHVPGWTLADGQCLQLQKAPELASALHEGDYWPYGQCEDGFRIPDLRSKQTPLSGSNPTAYFIKVWHAPHQ